MITEADQRLLTADEFLRIIFGSDDKPELDNGVVRMRSGATRRQAQVRLQVQVWLSSKLRGTGLAAYGPDFAVRTHELSVRYPGVVVEGHGVGVTDADLEASDPRVAIEMYSWATDGSLARFEEYQRVRSIDTVALVDCQAETVRLAQRLPGGDWADTSDADGIACPSLGFTVPSAIIFARD